MNELQPFGDISNLDKQGVEKLILEIERLAMREDGIKVDVEVKHHFSKDVYAREMIMPKGLMIVGKQHRHENLCIISAGEVSVLSIDGLQRIKAPFTFVASPGAKRVIYSHQDTVWTVIHGTSETDLEKIENEFIVTPQLEATSKGELPCHG